MDANRREQGLVVVWVSVGGVVVTGSVFSVVVVAVVSIG